jgi:hypothetical protein
MSHGGDDNAEDMPAIARNFLNASNDAPSRAGLNARLQGLTFLCGMHLDLYAAFVHKSRRNERFMTPKMFVRREYPQAHCKQIGECFQIVTPLQDGRVLILGEGRRCKTAWADAFENSQRSQDPEGRAGASS